MSVILQKLEMLEKVFPNNSSISGLKTIFNVRDGKHPITRCKFENLTGTWRVNTDYSTGMIDAFLELIDYLDAQKNSSEDKAAADKAAADKAAADKAAADKAAADKATTKPVAKEKTIICTKGKSSLKVIGKNPKCPSGYKVKK
jgi:hypothetical protein